MPTRTDVVQLNKFEAQYQQQDEVGGKSIPLTHTVTNIKSIVDVRYQVSLSSHLRCPILVVLNALYDLVHKAVLFN